MRMLSWNGPHEFWPWTASRIRCGELVVFSHPDELPPEAAADKAAFHGVRQKSHISIPLHIDGEIVGVLAFGTVRAERSWPAELLERVRVIGEIFAKALLRQQADWRVREVMEQVAQGLSSKVIAQQLGISSRTVEAHRGHLLDKLAVGSIAELIHRIGARRA
jgi:DNA-binding CsgD family transcriptional regulator